MTCADLFPPNYPGHIARESGYTQRAGLALGGLLARLIFPVVAKVKVGHVDIHPAVGRGAVIAFNHRSMLDYLVCSMAFQRWGVHPHFFARGDLFARPVVGPFLRLIRAIPAGHGPGTTATVDTAIDILRRGGVVALPPEGKVVDAAGRAGEVGTIRAGTPILLLAIRNSDAAWPPGRRVPVVRPPWRVPRSASPSPGWRFPPVPHRSMSPGASPTDCASSSQIRTRLGARGSGPMSAPGLPRRCATERPAVRGRVAVMSVTG